MKKDYCPVNYTVQDINNYYLFQIITLTQIISNWSLMHSDTVLNIFNVYTTQQANYSSTIILQSERIVWTPTLRTKQLTHTSKKAKQINTTIITMSLFLYLFVTKAVGYQGEASWDHCFFASKDGWSYFHQWGYGLSFQLSCFQVSWTAVQSVGLAVKDKHTLVVSLCTEHRK